MFTLALVKFFCDFVIPCEFPFDPPSPERSPRARHISEITAAAPGRTHPHYRRYVFDRGVPFFERTDSRRAVANSQDCVVPGVKRVISGTFPGGGVRARFILSSGRCAATTTDSGGL